MQNGSIHFSGVPWPFLVVVAVAAVFLLRHYARFLTRVRFPRPMFPLVLRAAAYAAIIFLAAGPTVHYTARRPVPKNIAVLIDTSQSMYLPDAGGKQSRLQRAAALAEKLRGIPGVRPAYFTFDSRLRRVADKQVSSLRPVGGGTQLYPALLALSGEASRSFSAVVVFSDGRDRTGVRIKTPVRDESGRPVPVHAIGLGAAGPERNIALSTLLTPETAYTAKPFTVSGTLRGVGIASKPVSLEFSVGGKRIRAIRIAAAADDVGRTFAFTYSPGQSGLLRVSVLARTEAGETTDLDNLRTAFVRVYSSKKEILYVDSPRWEYTFLHRELMSRRDITPSFLVLSPAAALPGMASLRARLGDAGALSRYEMIVIGAVRPMLRDAEAAALAAYARNGGFLVLLGGNNSLLSAGNPVLRDLGPRPAEAPDAEGAFFLRLTQPGRAAAVLRLDTSAARSAQQWESLPYLYSFSPLDPGSAETLAEHPWKGRGSRKWPLALHGKTGRGRYLLFAFEGMWRWKFAPRGGDAYSSLWNNILAEALRPPLGAPVTLYLPRRNVQLGDRICFDIAVRGTTNRVGVELRREKTAGVQRIAAANGPQGTSWRACAKPVEPGMYSARAVADGIGRSAPEPLSIDVSEEEFLRTSQNDIFMRALAADTGGAYLAEPRPRDITRAVARNPRYREEHIVAEIWRYPWIYLCILLLPFAEWSIRRREGLT